MAGPTRSRGELIPSFAGSLFAAMLGEVVMDAALQAHRDLVRSRAICDVCGMRCGSVHVQASPSNNAGHSTAAPGSPTDAGVTAGGMSATAKDKSDGNIYFECTNCQKKLYKIASNRYAPHLSSCLGIGTGSRRGAARNAAAKNKPSAEPDRAGSPFVSSDYGSPQEEVSGKGKGKAKNGKKVNGKAVESGMNGNHKRLMTPDTSSTKKAKKHKASIAVSEHLLTLASDESNIQKPHILASPKQLSKEGKKSTSPYVPRSPSVASASQYSGNESPSASGSGSSLNMQSPRLSGAQRKPSSTDRNSGNSRRHSLQLGSGKPQVAMPEVAAKRKTEDKEDLDFIDVDGEDRDESSPDST